MPMMAFAQDDDDDATETDQAGIYENFSGGFGAAFGDSGYGGQLLGSVFEMLLLQGLDLKNTEMTEGVFVMSAEKEETFEGNKTFEAEDTEIHIIDDLYSDIPATTPNDEDMVYVEVNRTGGFDFNLTVGAAITLLIWDYDNSFIEAASRVIDWAKEFNEDTNGGEDEPSQEVLEEGIAVLSWLLIHINDIFTGDELFVLNPITWQKLDIDPWPSMKIEKKRYYSEDQIIGGDRALTTGPSGEVESINLTANIIGDSYTEWLFSGTSMVNLAPTIWTQFSFDLAQLWVKNFHVEVDVGELAKGEDANMADAFSGLDIEFFLFTHHLGGAFLYNDTNADNKITINYTEIEYEDPYTGENKTGQVPDQNEVTHQLILGEVGEFDFSPPEVDEETGDVSWGLEVKDGEIAPVPVGVDLNNYLGVEKEQLGSMEFGLVFKKDIAEEPNEDGTYDASGRVKLAHNFAPWNDPASPYTKADLGSGNTGLDMAIIYISSIFHFHLQVDNEKEELDPEDSYGDEDYEVTEESVKVGNYMDPDSEEKLEFIDLASEPYQIGAADADGNPVDDTDYSPTTAYVPVGLWEATGEAHQTNKGDTDTETDDFTTDVKVEASFNIGLYAVCYPMFNGTGNGIWHDPTFSVYMVFTPQDAGFWALILLIAGVGLVGIATVLIKRRKDNRF